MQLFKRQILFEICNVQTETDIKQKWHAKIALQLL